MYFFVRIDASTVAVLVIMIVTVVVEVNYLIGSTGTRKFR